MTTVFRFFSCATILMLKKNTLCILRIAEHQHENTQVHLCFTLSLTHMHTVCTIVGTAILQWGTR